MHDIDKGLYDPNSDTYFQKPYIDVDEWRETSVRHRYVHGGFEGTDTRFSFFFPEKDAYEGRFYHFVPPAAGHEDASINLRGIEDKIAFALTHGGYFVESNMGVTNPFAHIPDPAIQYRASAAAAEYSREIVAKMYGDHRPYGYIYGGSGGGFKTMACIENTATWDGAVPYVIGSPMAIPNCFTVRAHAKRLLRGKLHLVADAVEVGGNGNQYEGLNDEQCAALEEITRMGFPPRAWYQHETLDDGSLPLLTGYIYALDNEYFEDFWKLPGYLGTDVNGSAVRDRVKHQTSIVSVNIPDMDVSSNINKDMSGVDESWKRMQTHLAVRPTIMLDSVPAGNLYMGGMQLIIQSGAAAGYRLPVERIENNQIVIGEGFGLEDMLEKLSLIKPGDAVLLDNSDYIAIQTYHRHQVPEEKYEGFEQFKDNNGKPIYPQRSVLIGPIAARGAAGSVQSGKINGKVISVAALLDESAFPWQPDWYRTKVKEHLGDAADSQFRLWFVDNAFHGDAIKDSDDLHLCGYLGVLYQALLDVSKWVEKGEAPAANTHYTVNNGQVAIADDSRILGGLQPTIDLLANGSKKAIVKPGETVRFTAELDVPNENERLLEAEWVFDDKAAEVQKTEELDGTNKSISSEHSYAKPGIYYAVLRVTSCRGGFEADNFTKIKNLARVRIVVQN